MNRQQLVTQAKREFWENKVGFFYTPLIVTALFLLIVGIGFIQFVSSSDSNINIHLSINDNATQKAITYGEILEKVATDAPDIFRHAIEGLVYVNTSFLVITFLIIILNYAHSCLFDDRKNRDILFWRSMPISETMNVLVKLGYMLFYFPLVVVALNIVVVVFTLTVATVLFAIDGVSVGYLLMSIVQCGALATVVKVFGMSLAYTLLSVPVMGFILLASAYAKRSPFVISSLVAVMVLVMDKIVYYLTGINLNIINILRSYGDLFASTQSIFESGSFSSVDVVSVAGYLIAMVIGALLVSAAIWMRNNRYEI